LAGAAIAATEDSAVWIEGNVIIGKLIPAGTGFVHGRFIGLEDTYMAQQDMLGTHRSVSDEDELSDLDYSFSD